MKDWHDIGNGWKTTTQGRMKHIVGVKDGCLYHNCFEIMAKDWQIVAFKYPKNVSDIFKSAVKPKYAQEGICKTNNWFKKRIPVEIWEEHQPIGSVPKGARTYIVTTQKQGDK